jgi:TolB-like protein/cytochrome c-type biogenesis protein CcmH/NrfG
VFVSYAREDVAAARRIAAALQAAQVEVWIDQFELRGGDAWDAKIRRQIRECTLFVPVISANTQARLEGYFRIEWKLAAQRTHAMAAAKPFLLPAVIDGTLEEGAHVPEEFQSVHWMRCAGDDELAEFCARVRKLLERSETAPPFAGSTRAPFAPEPRPAARALAAPQTITFSPLKVGLALLGAAALGLALWTPFRPEAPEVARPATVSPQSPAVQPPAADLAPAKSVAVLPFTNLSDERSNEYFSDGISEELLNVLARVPGLRVAARTSSFYFKGKSVPVAEIARQLGVAYLVEGSVRQAGNRVRITVKLIKATDGFPVWSDAFDRELKNIFAVQDEIAELIAGSLKLEIGVAASGRGEVNAQAYQLYLEGRQAWSRRTPAGLDRAEQCFDQALALEPKFARALLGRADVALIRGMERQDIVEYSQRQSAAVGRIVSAIEQALALEPDLAEAHASLGNIYWLSWRFEDAERALRRAITLDPNYATAHLWLGRVLQADGRVDEALIELQRAVELDPLSSRALDNYSNCLLLAERLPEGLAAAERAMALQPDNIQAQARRASALADLGRTDEAVTAARMLMAASPMRATEAAYTFARCGLKLEAEHAYGKLVETRASGVIQAYVLAAMGRTEEALQALTPATLQANVVDYLYYWPVFDGLRSDPRFGRVLTEVGVKDAHDRAQAERAAWRRAKAAKK